MTLKLAIFASHGGSNLQSIIDAIKSGNLNAEIKAVISNNSDSMALQRARNENIPAYHISEKQFINEHFYTDAILNILHQQQIYIIVLAGYMKKLNSKIIKEYKGKILNIHPALLPKFGGKGMYGLNVHKAVIADGETKSGCTVHIIDEEYDKGRILSQFEVPVLTNDTPELLATRVLEQEHKLYPSTLQRIAIGEITLA